VTLSILIVDDSETDRYVLRRYLKRSGLNAFVAEVGDGAEALDYFSDYQEKRAENPETFPPLIVFLDINMPKVDGFEFLEKFDAIRTRHGMKSTIVMMFTSSPCAEDRERSLRWDFVSQFLVKGEFSAEDLTRLLRERLDALAMSAG